MLIPSDIIACILTLASTAIVGLLTLVAHIGMRINERMAAIGTTLAAIDKRNTLEDERHANLAKDVQEVQARLDRKGVLAQ